MAVVRNIQNDDLYLYLGEDRYRNMRTMKEGFVAPEMAAKTFKINVEATYFYHQMPIFESFINRFNLKFDNNKNTKQ